MPRRHWSTVWITGASRGIGEALAQALAERGCTVAISARGAEELERLSRLARERPVAGRLLPYPLDVTDADACRAVFERIEADLGPIDLCILNAGSHRPVRCLGAAWLSSPNHHGSKIGSSILR